MSYKGANRARGWATVFALSVVLLFSSRCGFAADNIWSNTSGGSWENSANWSLGLAPTNTDSMYITNNGTYTVNIDNTTANTGSSSTWLTVSNLTVGAASGSQTLLVDFTNTARSVLVRQNTTVGISAGGQGNLILTNGSFTTGTLTLGTAAGAIGNLNVYGVTLRVTNSVVSSFTIGSTAGSTGLVTLVGGTIIATNTGSTVRTTIGSSGYGRVVISNGTLFTRAELIGVSARGDLVLLAGGTNISNNGQSFSVGGPSGGFVAVDGGSLQVTGASSRTWFGQANNDQGTLIVSNGSALFQGQFVSLGGQANSVGDWKLFGGTTTVTTTTFAIGDGDSTHRGKGTVLVSGGLLDASTIAVDLGDEISTGLIDLRSGTVRANGLNVAFAASGTGTVNVAGGNLISTNAANNATIEVGAPGTGRLNLTNGVITVDRLIATNGAKSVLGFVAGTLNVESTIVSNGVTYIVGSGTAPAQLNLQGGTHTFANGLTVNTNAALSGDGFSVLTLGGNLSYATNATLVVDLSTNSVTPGTGYDRAFVTGGVSIANSILTLRITNFTTAIGSQFTIIDNDGTGDAVTGMFFGLTNNAFIDASANGQDGFFRIRYDAGDGNDVVLFVTVPEPGGTALCLLAAAGAMLLHRTQRTVSHSKEEDR